MELYDKEGNKYSKLILDSKLFNNFNVISNFMENPSLLNDAELNNILSLNYCKYGIVTKSMIINLDVENKILFKNADIINDFKDLEIIEPIFFLNEINFYIKNIDELTDFLEKKHKEIYDLDNKIIFTLNSLRNKHYYDYLKNLIDLNNFRLMINRIFFEYFQELTFFNNKLKQIKYDFFITENNIKVLHSIYYNLKTEIKNILSERFILLVNDNEEEVNIKCKNGSIKYEKFINIIKKRIENI